MTSPDMLSWQYRSLLEELQQIQLHASDPNCPCNLADLGEYCLPKHCLNVHSLAKETAAMDAANAAMLVDLADSALTLHIQLKDRIVCSQAHKDEPEATEWAREWRKKVEPFYYACGVTAPLAANLKAGIKLAQPRVKISGTCTKEADGGCSFTVKREGEKVKATGIQGMVDAALRLLKEKETPAVRKAMPLVVELAGKTFVLAPETVTEMSETANKTTSRERGFMLCKGKDDMLRSGAKCTGNRCSIRLTDCARENVEGKFHTHPTGDPSVQRGLSVRDLENISGTRLMTCISGKDTDMITCAAHKPGAELPQKRKARAWPFIPPTASESVKDWLRGGEGKFFFPKVGAAFEYAEFPKEVNYGAAKAAKLSQAQEGQKEAQAEVGQEPLNICAGQKEMFEEVKMSDTIEKVHVKIVPEAKGDCADLLSPFGRGSRADLKNWAAILRGTDPKWQFERQFLNRARYGSTCFLIDDLQMGDILEIMSLESRGRYSTGHREERLFIALEARTPDTLIFRRVERQEVIEALRAPSPTKEVPMSDPILSQIISQICATGGCFAAPPRSKKPICTPQQNVKLEHCRVKVKDRNIEQGCSKPEGTGSRKCPSAFAVCSASIGCRPGRKSEK